MPDAELRAFAQQRLEAVMETTEDTPSRVVLAAARFKLHDRSDAVLRAMVERPQGVDRGPFVMDTLRAEVGRAIAKTAGARPDEAFEDVLARLPADALTTRLTTLGPLLAALDKAASDDPKQAAQGLKVLIEAGTRAVPLLMAEVEGAVHDFRPGRRERVTRALLALGRIRDRAATRLIADALASEDGWVRVYAAQALGDLGDPWAVVPLVRQITLLGDPDRIRDQWDHPGPTNSNISEADWGGISYFVIDAIAADSLLRLGVRGAGRWLIDTYLDPRKKNYRIRALHEATDGLKRSVRGIPIDAWNVDGGYPAREKAFFDLQAWWKAHERDEDLLIPGDLDPQDPRFMEAARGLAAVFGGIKVREKMMANAAVVVLGPLMTPALAEVAEAESSPVHRAEIGQALGRVRDPAAIPTLRKLLVDRNTFVRARAAEGLGAYAHDHPEVRTWLMQLLASRHAAMRVAAMQSLVAAPRSADVQEALKTFEAADVERVAAGKTSWITPDMKRAMAVVGLVQEGMEHFPAIEAGLRDPQRAVRRTWWDLLRAALQLPDQVHDPVADPDDPDARHIERATVEKALEEIVR